MKEEIIKKVRDIEFEEMILTFSTNDVFEILKEHAENRGYKVQTITPKTDWKYTSDEWGMNRSVTTSFNGMVMKVEKDD